VSNCDGVELFLPLLVHEGANFMSATVDEAIHPVFTAKDGQLWLGTGEDGREPGPIAVDPPLAHGSMIAQCSQIDGSAPGSTRLSLVVRNSDTSTVYTALIADVQRVSGTRTIDARLLKPVLSSAAPVTKLSAVADGAFVSTGDGALQYVDTSGAAPVVHTLVSAPPAAHMLLSAAPGPAATSSSGPMDDILAAKDGIAQFLTNLVNELPKIVQAVEQKVGQELLTAFGSDIKAAQAALGEVFNKPLASLIQQNPQPPQSNNALAAVTASPGEPAEFAVRRLFVSKLDLNQILNPYSRHALSMEVPAPGPVAADAGGSDPLEALGKLFEPLKEMLNGANTQNLLAMGAEDLIEAISGSKSISDVLNDFFGIFKIDDTMNAFHSILSGGQCSTLVGQVTLSDYLNKPVENAFFTALYDHYYPGKPFTLLDFGAFMGALFGYVAFAAQGKSDTFHTVFSDQQSLNELTGAPAKLVQAISGASAPLAVMMSATRGAEAERMALAADGDDTPPDWRIGVASAFSGLMTLVVGAVGAVSFGTGLLASPMVAGVAAGAFQCLGGIIQNGDTRDAKWDLLGGFAGGFTGAFLSTVIGNRLFASWAQNGATPTDRIQKLKLIMIGFTLTLGGGGGAIVSSLLKNYMKSKTLVFNDPLALTTGAIGGLGGGAMGCGLHFMGGISGSKCLPVALSQADANTIGLPAIVAIPPPGLNNVAALPVQNPAFPPAFAAAPNTAMGIYRTAFADGAAVPPSGRSIAFVTWDEFTRMDGPAALPTRPTDYYGQRQKLFWLEAAPPIPPGNNPPAAARRADLVIGVHGIGRYVFPCITHRMPGANNVDFTRPMYKDDFVAFLAADAWITGFLNPIRANRSPIIKLAVCFSALPLGCCSLSQELATELQATVYGGRPPVYPWLSNNVPRVPGMGGWIRYDP
jgi:hypothetical protein